MEGGQEILVDDLQSSTFLDVLREFQEVLRSCLGPKGGLKVLVSSGGISITSSSSSRVLNTYMFSHPVCVLISQIMKSQTTTYADHGLFTGVLAISLVEKILKQDQMRQMQASELIQDLSLQMCSLLDRNSIRLKLDFSTVTQLLPIVKTIISSKPGCGLSKKEIETLSVQIVKVFLNTINENFGDVVLLHGSSIEESSIVNGVLYQIDINENYVQDFVRVSSEQCSGNISLLLFDIMLTNTESEKRENTEVTFERGYDVLKDAIYVLECAVKIGVKIIACQKVVHNSLQLFIKRNGLLLLDRLGSELCNVVKRMSGAKPVSSLRNTSLKLLEFSIGYVDSVKYVRYGSRSYVSLEKRNTNAATLLLWCPNGEAFAELKIVTQQALKALRQVTCQPYVVPGAGCLEMWLATQLRVQGAHHTAKKILQNTAVGWLQKSLISIASVFETSPFIAADTVFCHSWSSWDPDDSSTCSCGLVRTPEVKAAGGIWVQPNLFATNDLMFASPELFFTDPLIPNKVHENSIVDVYISKRSAIKLALDTCVNILCIGFMIHKPPV